MPVADSPIILTCVVIYLIVCLGIGIWAMRRTKTISDFLLAGQSLGPFVLAMAAMSSIMSGFGFIGGPGLTFESGMSSAWMTFAAMLGAPLVWIMLGKRLRLVAEARPVLTLPDVVAARYGGRLPRFFMALAILLGVLGYLGTQVMAIGLVSVAVLGVDLPLAMLIGLGVLAFYSVAGGILASVYTDLFQGLLMMGAALVVFFVAIDKAGGLSAISTTLHQMDPEFIGPWGTRGALAGLSWYLLFGLGQSGQPHVITKLMMIKNIRDLKWGGLMTGLAYSVLSLLWLGIGLSMRTLVETGRQGPLGSPDHAAPVFLIEHCPELLAGVVFAGLLAAIMSTADSFLNIGAAAVVRDMPTAIIGRPLRRELFWTRVMTGVILVGSALFALYMENLIALLGTFGWGTFAAAIVPSVAIGLNWKRATAAGCVASIITSIVLNFSLELAQRNDLYLLPEGFAVGAFSLLAALLVFVGVSLAGPRQEIPTDIKAAMEV